MPVSSTTDSPHQEQHSKNPSPVSPTFCPSLGIPIMSAQSLLLIVVLLLLENPVFVLNDLSVLYSVVVLVDPVSLVVSVASVSLYYRIFYTIKV